MHLADGKLADALVGRKVEIRAGGRLRKIDAKHLRHACNGQSERGANFGSNMLTPSPFSLRLRLQVRHLPVEGLAEDARRHRDGKADELHRHLGRHQTRLTSALLRAAARSTSSVGLRGGATGGGVLGVLAIRFRGAATRHS